MQNQASNLIIDLPKSDVQTPNRSLKSLQNKTSKIHLHSRCIGRVAISFFFFFLIKLCTRVDGGVSNCESVTLPLPG